MKKIAVFTLLLVSLLSAGWIRTMGSSESPKAPSIITHWSDTTGVYIRVAIPGFSEKDTTVDNENYKRITLPEEPIDYDTANVGKPQMPYVSLRIAVPDSAEFDITVRISDHVLFQDYALYPVPEIVFEDSSGWVSSKEEFTLDESFYLKDTLYPGYFFEVNSDEHWREQRVLEIMLYPIQCNPGHDLMYVYTELYLNIEYTGTVIENALGLGPFEDIGHEELLNYAGIDTSMQPESQIEPAVRYYSNLRNTDNVADYLIVTHEAFLTDTIDSTWIHQFAQWRVDHNEFSVAIVEMQDVYSEFDSLSPDSVAQLRDFLMYAYNNWLSPSFADNHFAYCLLIGDWDYIPTDTTIQHPTGKEYLVPLEGYLRDMHNPRGRFDDIMLGRWPVKAQDSAYSNQLAVVAQKTLNYETNQSAVTDEWRRRGFLISGCDGFEGYVSGALPYFTDIGYDTFTADYMESLTVYDTVGNPYNPFPESVHKYFNMGEIITAFCDHGGPLGWCYSYGVHNYAPLLENGGKLPLVLSYACNSGNFLLDHPYYDTPQGDSIAHGYDTCFAECLLLNQNGGAVAFYGGAGLVPIRSYNRVPMKRILCMQHWIVGEAVMNSIQHWGDYSGIDYCLLGDPALDLGDYTAHPDLPDLVVRPRGTDVRFSSPFPYQANGDLVPVTFAVWNIGGAAANNVQLKVRLKVPLFSDTATVTTLTVNEIKPRDSIVVQFMWDPTIYHLDNGITEVLPDGFEGEIGNADFVFVVDPENSIAESWEHNNASHWSHRLTLYPNLHNWPKMLNLPISQPAIADLDGDETAEIVVITGRDSIFVFTLNGDVLSGWPQHLSQAHSLVVGDINADNLPEVVVVSDTIIAAYNHSGSVLYNWPVQIPSTSHTIMSMPSLGKIDDISSQYYDVIVTADPTPPPESVGYRGREPMRIYVYDYQGNLRYHFDTPVEYNRTGYPPKKSGPSIGRVGSANENMVVSYEYSMETRTDIYDKNGLTRSLDYGGDNMTAALFDITEDHYAEIFIGDREGSMRAYDAVEGSTVWQTQTGGAINTAPAIGDINTDPGFSSNEISFGNDEKEIWAMRAENGESWFPWFLVADQAVVVSLALAYLDDDQGLDLVIGSHDGYIHALTALGDTIEPFPLSVFGKASSPLIGDIDGNGKSETILSSSDGYLHVWQNRGSSVPAHTLEWPQFHHDYQRTGLYGWIGGISGSKVTPGEITQLQPTTLISLYVEEDGLYTQMSVYNSEGNAVRTLLAQALTQGLHHLTWDGTDNNLIQLPNGVYYIEIEVQNETKLMPIVINR